MRMLGKLAVAVGATAVVLLSAPGANAAEASSPELTKSVAPVGEKAGLPLGSLAGLGGLVNSVPIVNQVLGKLVTSSGR